MGAKMTRRRFLGVSAAAVGSVAFPYVVPSRVWAQPPSEQIVTGHIGTGGRGTGLLRQIVDRQQKGQGFRVGAVCDVDSLRLQRALQIAKAVSPDARAYSDFRDLLDDKNIDAVYIATPPHWHALVCIYAAQAGKDIYCEKPMTKFIHEGRAVVEAVERYGRVFHIGTFGRYGARQWRKLFLSGALGKPVIIRMNKHKYNWKVRRWSGRTDLEPQEPPPNLNWDMWLGPAPYKPYHPHRCHSSFRGYWDYDGGGFSDMGAHYFDPVQYMIGADNSGPLEIEAVAPWPAHPDAVGMWETITFKFPGDIIVRCNSGEWGKSDPPDAPWIEGPNGKVFRDGRTDPPDLMEATKDVPEPPEMISWEEALRTRRQPGGNAEVSHRVATILHLGNLAIRLGRKLRWDPEKEQFIGDEEANRFVNIPLRAPWHL